MRRQVNQFSAACDGRFSPLAGEARVTARRPIACDDETIDGTCSTGERRTRSAVGGLSPSGLSRRCRGWCTGGYCRVLPASELPSGPAPGPVGRQGEWTGGGGAIRITGRQHPLTRSGWRGPRADHGPFRIPVDAAQLDRDGRSGFSVPSAGGPLPDGQVLVQDGADVARR